MRVQYSYTMLMMMYSIKSFWHIWMLLSHSPIPSLLEWRSSMRGAEAPSESMISADCLSRASSHRTPAATRLTLSSGEYNSCSDRKHVYYTLTMSDGGQKLYKPAPINTHKKAYNTVERCKSYLNKQRNGVHAGDGGSVNRISGHDMQSTNAALHNLLHSHSILRERERKGHFVNSVTTVVCTLYSVLKNGNCREFNNSGFDSSQCFSYFTILLMTCLALLRNNNII